MKLKLQLAAGLLAAGIASPASANPGAAFAVFVVAPAVIVAAPIVAGVLVIALVAKGVSSASGAAAGHNETREQQVPTDPQVPGKLTSAEASAFPSSWSPAAR